MKKFFILLFMQIALCCTTFAANYLTFTAEKDNSSFSIEDHIIKSNIFYSLDNGETWKQLTGQPVKLAKGDRALLKGNKPDSEPTALTYCNFKMEGSIAASGSVMSLVDGNGEGKTIPYACCFCRLFENCTSLTQAPELPATTLAERCYFGMFWGCTNLTQAPKLPATTLAEYCYYGMFNECTSLTQAPELPATTLAERCYRAMFVGCEKLSHIKVAFTDWGTDTEIWLADVAETGTFICPEELSLKYGYNFIPEGWTVKREKDSSTEAVAATEGTTVHTSGLTIFVSNADTDIEVYEVGGRLIGKARNTNGDTQITVPQSGIYLVKAGAQTFKVAL